VTSSSDFTRTIRYGDDPAQFVELTMPSGAPRGVVVVVHGGFWKPEHGIEHARPLVPSLVAAGWAAWAIEYRRTGAATTLPDVRAAVDLVSATPEVDLPVRIGLGHSAGGHLVTWAASGGRLTHVISQAGVLDLAAAHEQRLGDGAVERFLGHPYGADPADAEVDPIRQAPLAVPVWCVHGTADDVVPLSQSGAYVTAARDGGGTAELVEVGGDHFTVVDPESDAWTLTLQLLDRLAP
jgi:acetyl esterase/lipase